MSSKKAYLSVIEGLKERGRRNADLLALLQFDWPVSEAVIQNISGHITEDLCTNDTPVIYEIIESALLRYSEAVHFKGYGKLEDPARLGMFLDTLISEASRIIGVTVHDERGKTWTVTDGISFKHWCDKAVGGLTLTPSPVSDEKRVRHALYKIVTNEQIQQVLRRANYEDALVGGTLDISH